MPATTFNIIANSAVAGPSVARRLPRTAIAVRSASTQHSRKPSKPSARKAAPQPAPRAPRKDPTKLHANVVRRLVGLHHASAGFMRSTSDVTHAFENNFKQRPQGPYFEPIDEMNRNLGQRMAARRQSRVLSLIPRSDKAYTDITTHVTRIEAGRRPAVLHTATFRPPVIRNGIGSGLLNSSFEEDSIKLTDRELQVKEALFGTWQRGGQGMKGTMPGYDGVLEYLKAKKQTIAEAAEQWDSRELKASPSNGREDVE